MINGRTGRRFATVLATTSALLFMPPVNARAVPTSQGYSGTTADGGAWVADVPSAWNGTLVLYSHGYGPLVAADAPTAPFYAWRSWISAMPWSVLPMTPTGPICPGQRTGRPVPGPRRSGEGPAVGTQGSSRLRHLDGRVGERTRRPAVKRAHRRRAHGLRRRRGRRPAQQLPAGRGIRHRQAAGPERAGHPRQLHQRRGGGRHR